MPTFDFLNLAKKAVNVALGFAFSPIGIFSASTAAIFLICDSFTNFFKFVDLPPIEIDSFNIFSGNDFVGFFCYVFALDKLKTLIYFICDYSFAFLEFSIKIILSSMMGMCVLGLSSLIRKSIKSRVD